MRFDFYVKEIEQMYNGIRTQDRSAPTMSLAMEIAKLKGMQELISAIQELNKTIEEQSKNLEKQIVQEGDWIRDAIRDSRHA